MNGIRLNPLQKHFIEKVIKMADEDEKVKELFKVLIKHLQYFLSYLKL